eukprot:14592994-Alexandrium_andersonii.AAC.1
MGGVYLPALLLRSPRADCGARRQTCESVLGGGANALQEFPTAQGSSRATVSYTHLTLPTICSV